jgi:hypothetical protein
MQNIKNNNAIAYNSTPEKGFVGMFPILISQLAPFKSTFSTYQGGEITQMKQFPGTNVTSLASTNRKTY